MKFRKIAFRFGIWTLLVLGTILIIALAISATYRDSFEDHFGVNITSILGFWSSLSDEEIQILQPVIDRKLKEYSSKYLITLDKRNNLLKNIPTDVTKEAINILEQLKDIDDELERRQVLLNDAIGAAKYFDFKIKIDHTQG